MAGGSENGGAGGVSEPPRAPPSGRTGRRLPHEEEMPRVRLTRRQITVFAIFMLSAIAFLYFVLPKLTSAGETVHRIEHGDKWWIAIGVVLEALSFGGYILLFRTVFVKRPHPHSHLERINWRVTYEITMAGLAATRLFAAAGAGGIALTAWALRRSGMEPRLVACRLVAFNVILYTVYAGSMLIDGLGLGIGLFPGGGSFAITFVPAIVAAVLFSCAFGIAALPGDVERRFGARAEGRRADVALLDEGGDGARRSSRAASGPRGTSCAPKNGASSARSLGGALTSRCCGRCSTRSASRRRSP